MEERRLSVIMFTDIVGYSSLMQADEKGALQLLTVHNRILDKLVAAHEGHTIKTIGDAYLVEFSSVANAVECAAAIQKALAEFNLERPGQDPLRVRVGIHAGDVFRRAGDIFGDGVNVASRLQSEALPGSIFVSGNVFSMLRGKTEIPFRALGRRKLKNITDNVFVYEVLWDPARSAEASLRPPIRIGRLAVAALLVLAAGLGTFAFLTRADRGPKRVGLNIISFEDRTKDPRLRHLEVGSVVADALVHEMQNWSPIRVISPLRLRSHLRQQKIEERQLVDDSVLAAETTRKLDGRLLLMGRIKKNPQGYVVSATLYDLADDRLIDEFSSSERNEAAIIDDFVHRLAARLRSKIAAKLGFQDDLNLAYAGRAAYGTKSPEAYAAFVRAFRDTQFGYFDRAIEGFHQAVALDPEFALAYSELACSYSWAKNEKKAEEWATKAYRFRDRFKGSSKDALLFRGNVAWGQGKHKEATLTYQTMIDLYPDDRDGYLYAGTHAFYAKNEARQAEVLLRKAIRLSPEYYAGYRDLAYVLRAQGRKDEAVKVILQFIHDFPESPGVEILRNQVLELRQ